ncbi:MAG: hypothetical protein HYR72_06850 [Deltaproteobacteria bacterium]|nr:hypothetical protein [Deltaproteobacteria bacterium]MBI3387165.1 hypothetical protein [Deltaproteobacteria bacterium]
MSDAAATPALRAFDDRIDHLYRRWLRSALPPTLREVARALPHAMSFSPQPRWRTWRDVYGTPVFRALPFLIAEAFPSVPRATLEQLGVAHVLIILLALIDDRLNDRQLAFARDTNLLRYAVEGEIHALLGTTVGPRADFWRRFRRDVSEYVDGHSTEPVLWIGRRPAYTHSHYARDSAAKTAVCRITAVAVALLGGAPPPAVRRVVALLDHYLVGMQYLDDAVDWEEDFRGGRWTYFLQLHLRPQEARRAVPVTLAALRSRVATSQVTADFFARGSRHYAACLRLLGAFDMPTFRDWVIHKRDRLHGMATARRQQQDTYRQHFVQTLTRAFDDQYPIMLRKSSSRSKRM